ncbi:hypothetical protein glysoja_016516 [Glycine soja]|nr:hypothetical protein glysoja_016516 [Glycine soja]
MAKWCMLVLVLALAVATSARDVPNPKDAGLNDQKNFISYGGVGGYSGIGSNGLPFGGAGIGGGTTGIGGLGGFGGPIGGGGVGGGSIPHPTP